MRKGIKNRKITRIIYSENKRKAHDGNVLEMEVNYKQRNIKIFCRVIKETKQGHKPKRIFTKDENGKLIAGKEYYKGGNNILRV